MADGVSIFDVLEELILAYDNMQHTFENYVKTDVRPLSIQIKQEDDK
jgi:hypothetical protein